MESLLTKSSLQRRFHIKECSICGYSMMWVDGVPEKCPQCRTGVLGPSQPWTQNPKIEGDYWLDSVVLNKPVIVHVRPPVTFADNFWYRGPISCPERCPAVREAQWRAQKREEKKS